MGKAREFFVYPDQHLCLEPGGQASIGMTGEQQFLPSIHVIEHSAYLALKEQLARVEDLLNRLHGDKFCNCDPDIVCLHDEIRDYFKAKG